MEQKIGKTVPIVLIADDVEANRFMLKNIISEMGNQAVLAENGMQAVKLAQRMKPQLIILDIAMPEMDGYEACEKLKEDPDTRDIPIVFISALDDPNDIVRGFSLGGEDYIVKIYVKKHHFGNGKSGGACGKRYAGSEAGTAHETPAYHSGYRYAGNGWI